MDPINKLSQERFKFLIICNKPCLSVLYFSGMPPHPPPNHGQMNGPPPGWRPHGPPPPFPGKI